MPIWIGGNTSVVLAQLLGLNLTSAASWTLLACVMKGFAAPWSRQRPRRPRRSPSSSSSRTSRCAWPRPTRCATASPGSSAAPTRGEHHGGPGHHVSPHHRTIARPPWQARARAALVFYAAALVSTRCSIGTLAWLSFNLAFVVPLGLKSDVLLKVVRQAKEKLADVAAHPKVQELLQAMARPKSRRSFAVLKNGCTPKAQFVARRAPVVRLLLLVQQGAVSGVRLPRTSRRRAQLLRRLRGASRRGRRPDPPAPLGAP